MTKIPDNTDFNIDVEPTTIAEIAPRVVAAITTQYDLGARIRPKCFSDVCAELIKYGVTRDTSPELLQIKLQGVYVRQPQYFILNGTAENNFKALKTYSIENGEIVFPTKWDLRERK